MSASSWKKQSSRLKTGSMNLVNNDTIYGDNSTFNNLECKFTYVSELSSTTASFTTISAETAYLDSAYVNDLYITNLGQNNIPNDRWLNVDASNGIYVIDLSSSGNYTSIGGHSLMKQKTAWGSTAIGYDAMRNISTRTDLSFSNTAVGTSAMYGSDLVNGITGIKNAALGNNALSSITTGSNNSAFGYNSLSINTTGNNNSAFGYKSLSSNTTGISNTAAGELSLNSNTTGIFNVGVGSRSLLTNTIGSYNSVCGSCSMTMNETGCNNVACGHYSLGSNNTGCNNAAIGYNSMFQNKDASANTAIGASSLYSNKNGMNNVAIGYNALYSDVSGSFNTVVGANSDVSNTMLDRVQILGYNNKSAYSNVNIIGTDISASGPSKTFISNVADSSSSLISNVVMYDTVTKEMSYDSRMLYKVAADASGYTGLIIGDASQNTFIGGNLIMSQGNVGIGTSSPLVKLHVDNGGSASGTNIARIVQGSGSYTSVTDALQDPFSITSAISDPSNLTIGMGVDISNIVGYINVAVSGSVRPLYLNCRESAPVIALGNVGIGNTNPATKLDISGGSVKINSVYSSTGIRDASGILFLANDGSGNTWQTGAINTYIAANGGGTAGFPGGLAFLTKNPDDIISTPVSTKMVLDSCGNLGIGTVSPGQKLDVMGNIRSQEANAYIFQETLSSDYGNLILRAGYSTTPNNAPHIRLYGWNGGSGNDSVITFSTFNAERMRVSATGNVGIGTASPNCPLHINRIINPNDTITQLKLSHDSSWDLRMDSHHIAGNRIKYYLRQNFDGNVNDVISIDNGNVGIGTRTPDYPLHVRTSINRSGIVTYYKYGSNINDNGINQTSSSGIYVSIYCWDAIYTESSVYASDFRAWSDRRIKTNIVDIDDEKALSILRKIQPKTYDYVDKIQRGNANVIGFIAQEIKEIIPNAVKIMKKYIPNFYTTCQVSATDASNIVLVTSPIDLSWNPLHGSANASDASVNAFVDANGNACSDASGNKVFNVKLYDQSNNNFECKTTTILDKRSFLMDVTGSKMVDASGNLHLENDGGYFLYGQEVDDFHDLDKNAIFTVVTAAVQDIDRIVQSQQVSHTQMQETQSQMQETQSQMQAKQQADAIKIEALEKQVNDLQNKYKLLEDNVALLLSKM